MTSTRPACIAVVPFGVTAPSEARAAVDTDLHARGCDDEQRKVVLTVLTELVMNALLHGAGGEASPEDLADLDPDDADEVSGVLRVSWSLDDDLAVTVAVTDYGTEGAPHLEAPDDSDAGGRGLRLVEALTSTWSAERAGGATTVTATVPPQA